MIPDHKQADNQCRNLHYRLCDLAEVLGAYGTVLHLADTENDAGPKAAALGNLCSLAKTRGDLNAVEGYY